MLKCKNCGWGLSDDTRICTYCGRPVEPEDEEQRRRLMLRWHLSALLIGMNGPKPNFPLSPALSAKSSTEHLPAALVVLVISVLIFLNIFFIGSLRLQISPAVTPTPITISLPPHISVNPTLLDFGDVVIGSKAVLPVMIKTSSSSQISWKTVSGDVKWLNITLQGETKEPDSLREVIYDVTVNTSKLQAKQYSVTFTINSDGAAQQVHVKIQVTLPVRLPAAKLNVSPLLLDFGSQEVGKQKTLLLTVSNSGEKELDWMTDQEKTTWLTLETSRGKIASGGLPQIIKVTVDTTRLAVGRLSTRINLTSNVGHISVRVVLLVVPTSVNGPTLSSINPSKGPATGGTRITIEGSNFAGATAVSFGSTAASSFTLNSDSQITAVSSAGSDLVDVTVTTPGGTSAISTADLFTYIPPPTVISISPKCGLGDITSVTIIGTNFTGATAVSFGSTAASSFTFNSDSQITASSVSGTGTVDVTVTTPSGTSATGAADQFTPPSPPFVSSINPTSGPNIGGTSVTIAGSNFTCATSVSFSSTVISNFTVSSDGTQITVINPEGINTVDVTVTTPGGTSPNGTADLFTYIPIPAVTGISPKNGPATGGTSVTITGTGFTGATAVSFSGTASSSYSVNSDTKITAVSPAGSGTVDVTVTTSGGTSTIGAADQFAFIPVVTGVSPSSGLNGGGTTIVIAGMGFTGATAVSFGSRATIDFTVNSDTKITVVSPEILNSSDYSSMVDVTVTTPAGTSANSSHDQFTYLALPFVFSVNPGNGTVNGGTSVTIMGSGFIGATSVSFGSTAITDFTVISDTEITVVSPAGSGTVDVIVTSPGGTSATSAADQFTYQ